MRMKFTQEMINLSPFRQPQVLLAAFKVSRQIRLNCCMREASITNAHKGVGGVGTRWARGTLQNGKQSPEARLYWVFPNLCNML